VEDNNDCRELLEKLVNCFGYDVIKAGSGTEAITQASEKHPDLILMDICLPEMIGDEITARLKANPATRYTCDHHYCVPRARRYKPRSGCWRCRNFAEAV
jgi:CheY-like chemotaxis protein